MKITDKILIGLGSLIVLSIIGVVVFLVGWVSFIDNYEFGYTFDTRTGKVEPIMDNYGEPKTGYVITPPFLVKVHTIDLKPMQVCINANSRVLNCKLVKFNPKGFKLFVDWHGRDNYDLHNLRNILMSYAYDGTSNIEADYPFITIMKELQTNGNNERDIKTNTKSATRIDSTLQISNY
jgi:hypothetical protein